MDKPNVTSNGGNRSRPKARFSNTCCKANPAANIAGIANRVARKGSKPSHVASERIANPASPTRTRVANCARPDDTKDQRQAGGKQPIQPPKQTPLDDRAEPIEHAQCP